MLGSFRYRFVLSRTTCGPFPETVATPESKAESGREPEPDHDKGLPYHFFLNWK